MRCLIILLFFLIGCGITKDLKDTRALGLPYFEKIEESFFKHANRQGFVMDNESYSLFSSANVIMAHTLPIKKSLFEQDVANGALIGYTMVLAKTNAFADSDGLYEIKINDTSDMTAVTTATLNSNSGSAGNLAVTVTELEEYDERNPGDVCQDVLGGGCGAFYINFKWYCICVHPEIKS